MLANLQVKACYANKYLKINKILKAVQGKAKNFKTRFEGLQEIT